MSTLELIFLASMQLTGLAAVVFLGLSLRALSRIVSTAVTDLTAATTAPDSPTRAVVSRQIASRIPSAPRRPASLGPPSTDPQPPGAGLVFEEGEPQPGNWESGA